jgi:GT2 family glycosyltransferase
VSDVRVTVVVTVRQSYSRSLQSLASLYEQTSEPFHLVWVDARCPRSLRRRLKLEAAERSFTLISTNRYLSPNEARNIGLRHVDTQFVVFTDNDVIFDPGWLTALLACADATDAAIVGPIYCIAGVEKARVHMAGGDNRIVGSDSGLDLYERHNYAGLPLTDVLPELVRAPTELVEFHCMLVRCAVLVEIAPLDEQLISLCEHNDICLKVMRLGRGIWLEPAARVTYAPTVRTVADYLFFCYRWRDAAARATLDHFWRSWSLAPSPKQRELFRDNRILRWHGQPRPRRVNNRITAPVVARLAHLLSLMSRPSQPRVEAHTMPYRG